MHCTGPCRQGRKECPTPSACGGEVMGGTYWPLLAESKPYIAPVDEPMSALFAAIVKGSCVLFVLAAVGYAAASIFY